MSHLQLRCEAGVTAAHRRPGRSGFPVAGPLLSPSSQQVFLPEKPHDICSAELRPMSTLDVLEWWRRCITATDLFFPSLGRPGQNGSGICVIYWRLIQVAGVLAG